MSIEKITARILQEAQAEADSLKKSAEEETAAAIAEAKAQADQIAADKAAQAVSDAAVLVERKKSVAELEARKMRLAAKQDMIEKSFTEAMKVLKAMPEADYLNFLQGQLKGFSEGEVVLNAEDKKKIGASLAKNLAGTGLTVSEETANIQGGFILKNGSVSVNGSLESILEGEKKQITAKIAQTLFS